jgi:hypothetical protein
LAIRSAIGNWAVGTQLQLRLWLYIMQRLAKAQRTNFEYAPKAAVNFFSFLYCHLIFITRKKKKKEALGNFKRHSQDERPVDFDKNLRASLFNEAFLITTTFSQVYLDRQCRNEAKFVF